jgi:hypothetical protein
MQYQSQVPTKEWLNSSYVHVFATIYLFVDKPMQKMRRYEEFQRNASVVLVKEYLTCTDELTSICEVSRHPN